MRTLSPAQRRALRARAHHLSAFASVGHGGLTPAVLHEIDISLKAHELLKIRVFAAERDDREAMLFEICEALDAAPVQHLGKVLIVWRPAPAEEAPPPSNPARSAARRAPQARRPRSPLPRTPTRPVPAVPPPPRGKGRRGAARHDPSLGRDDAAPAAPGTRRKSTYTPKTTPKSFSAKPNPRSAWEKKPPGPRSGKAGARISSKNPRGGLPTGSHRGANSVAGKHRVGPATGPAAGARRRRKPA